MSSLRKRVNAELDRIREENGGTLKQRSVVDFARDPNTALHEAFNRQGLWNEKDAADQARLAFAGQLIRTYVIRDTGEDRGPVRALVSLIDDRKPKSGLPGYRSIEDVLSDDAMKANLIQTALMELRACQRRYKQLKEFADVWQAVDRVEQSNLPATELHASA